MISKSYIENGISNPIRSLYKPPKPKKVIKESDFKDNDKISDHLFEDKTINDEMLAEQYGEVRSISKDGDTLRVKDEKNDEEKDTHENLKQYSDTQLEAMFRSGKISGEAYALEVETRVLAESNEESDHSLRDTTEQLVENLKENSKKLAVYEALEHQSEVDLMKNKIILSDRTSDVTPVKTRLEAMDKVKNVILKPEPEHDIIPKKSDRAKIMPQKTVVGKVILPK